MKKKNAQEAIRDYLASQGHFFWINDQPAILGSHQRGEEVKLVLPRFIIIKDGWFIGLEVKGAHNLQEGKRTFAEKCHKSGGEYWMVSSVEEVKELGL